MHLKKNTLKNNHYNTPYKIYIEPESQPPVKLTLTGNNILFYFIV
jgi:hypothetical protein